MKNEQVDCIKLDISLSTIEVFEQFAHLELAVLLDSGNAEHANSRFDIIAINPVETLKAVNNRIYYNDTEVTDSPFKIMKRALNTLSNTKPEFDIPFTGGWLGYFGYDFGRYIEKIPSNNEVDIFLPDMQIGLYLDALVFDNNTHGWFYVSQPHHDNLSEYLALINTPSKNKLTFAITTPWLSNMNKSSYVNKFNQIQRYLKSGDCYQINLAQRFKADFIGDPWQAYKTLRNENKAPFSSYIKLNKGAIASVSPERFLLVNENKVETKPIKGTLPRLNCDTKDSIQAQLLKNSTKDRAENVMIVDLLRNDLGKVAEPGSVNVPKLFEIESFPAVHHLVSTVTCTLASNKCAIDLLEASFPGGSITGAPKIRAMEIIEELEPNRRSVYCGSIGYLSACGNMDTSITIRTLVFHNDNVFCWAGGGIVADSKSELEYQETYHKVDKILPVLMNRR